MAQSSGPCDGIVFLQIVFIGLKLTGHLDWSWWWVMSPTWIPLAIFALMFAIAVGVSIGSK